ncbi:hypothetical protein MRX96_032220 [Rhipicephalus microplus]
MFGRPGSCVFPSLKFSQTRNGASRRDDLAKPPLFVRVGRALGRRLGEKRIWRCPALCDEGGGCSRYSSAALAFRRPPAHSLVVAGAPATSLTVACRKQCQSITISSRLQQGDLMTRPVAWWWWLSVFSAAPSIVPVRQGAPERRLAAFRAASGWLALPTDSSPVCQ